jgi:hypothetical protein
MAADEQPIAESEMIAILNDLARNSGNAAARIAAIKTLREIGHGKPVSDAFSELDRARTRRRDGTTPPDLFTVEHFREYARVMVWDDGEHHDLEDWECEVVEDLFRGFKRNLWIIPEENGKSTLTSLIALYGADFTIEPWIPVCAAAARQARIIHDQASGFVRRTPGMSKRFRPQDGYVKIKSLTNGGKGIGVFAYDRDRADGPLRVLGRADLAQQRPTDRVYARHRPVRPGQSRDMCSRERVPREDPLRDPPQRR